MKFPSTGWDWSLPKMFARLDGLPRGRFRRLWVGTHRTLALTAGFLFVLMGLTGSLNVFQPELDAGFNPQLTIVQPAGEYRSLNEILAAVQRAHPQRSGSWTLAIPERPEGMLSAWLAPSADNANEENASLMVSVNPYTAEVTASRLRGKTVTTWILQLHEQLFLGQFGRKLIGCLGLLLMISLVTGLILWWPGCKRIRQARTPNLGTGPRLMQFNVHRLFGVYSAPVLLIVALTGFHLAYPDLLESVFKSSPSMGDIHGALKVQSTAVPNGKPVTVEESVLLARGLFPKSRLLRILTPQDSTGSYQIWFGRAGSATGDTPTAVVCVDQYSGHILHVENLRDRPAGDAVLGFLHELHSGAALGTPGRIVWSAAGLAPLLLYITGIRRWRQRRQIAGSRVS